jgi:hypothetical protein
MWDRTGAPCHVDSDSVICYGRARLLDDLTERAAALNASNRRDRLDVSDLPLERGAQCMAVEITLAGMTGRRERDRQRTYWRATFERVGPQKVHLPAQFFCLVRRVHAPLRWCRSRNTVVDSEWYSLTPIYTQNLHDPNPKWRTAGPDVFGVLPPLTYLRPFGPPGGPPDSPEIPRPRW